MSRITLLLLIIFLVLAIAPVHAQLPTSSPIPSNQQQSLQILQQLAQTMKDLSADNSSTVNGAVLMLGAAFFLLTAAFLVGVVWVARGGLKPLTDSNRSEREGRQNAESSELHIREVSEKREKDAADLRTQQAKSLERTADSLERATNILSGLETKEVAAAGRQEIIDAVNRSTVQDGEKTRQQLTQISEDVHAAAENTKDLITLEDLHSELAPVLAILNGLSDTIAKIIRRVEEQSSTRMKTIPVEELGVEK